jgi:hypothetical protein
MSVADLLALMKQGLAGLKTYAVEISAQGPSLNLTGSGVVELVDASTVHSHLSVVSSGRPLELVVYGTSYYLKTASKWIKLSSTAYGGLGIGSIGNFANAMEAATTYMKAVAVVGPDTVGGVACTHYRVTMDAVALEKLYGNGFHPAEKTFDWDVWMDDNGRVYQAVSSVKVSKGTVTTSTVMSKFNEPVTITPPKV